MAVAAGEMYVSFMQMLQFMESSVETVLGAQLGILLG